MPLPCYLLYYLFPLVDVYMSSSHRTPPEHWAVYYGRHLLTIFICGYLLFVADVLGVMLYSNKINRMVLYAAFVMGGVFAVIGLYLTFIVGRYNKEWEKTHQNYIYAATGSVVASGVLWIIAMWPVFHFWTLLLGTAWLFFALSTITIGSGKAKMD